ncbi:MAG: hypothetical protein ACT4NU_09290 [Chromatiales bacterium]
MRVNTINIVGRGYAKPVSAEVRAPSRSQRRLAGEPARVTVERGESAVYAGVVGREQAVRGAIVGQYVRMAQVASMANGERAGAQAAGMRGARRDLLCAMLLYMSGGAPAQERGQRISESI